ncbi:MAG: hypothetical protein PHT07_10020 [Paludibacter sp.]|nr:hypothetical protein [Paludibacter sp.]
MKTEAVELLAAFYVTSKYIKRFKDMKDATEQTIQQRIAYQISSNDEKVKSISAQGLASQREGIYRVMFGGASALAYVEEPARSVATFKYSVGEKSSKKVELKNKEDLLKIFSVESNKKISSAVVNAAIIDELTKRFPEMHQCNINAKTSTSLVASRKQNAPTIEEALDEVKHWLILKKIEQVNQDIDFGQDNPVMLFSEIGKRLRLAEDLKVFLSGCITETFGNTPLPSNEFAALQSSSRINYDRDILKNLVGNSSKFATIVDVEEVKKEKKAVEVRWCGKLNEIDGGILPEPLRDQLKNAQAPRNEKEVKSKLSERVFFQRQSGGKIPPSISIKK